MKYYYNCPIKAAYMAKYHGIFYSEPVAYGWHNGQYTIALSPHLSMNSDTKYYIHEESMELLKPMPQDIVTCPSVGGDGVQVFIACIDPYEDIDCYEQGCKLDIGNDETLKIIERNNMPFIWPEVENA